MSGLLCAGDLYVDRLTENGSPTGYLSVGNATRFQLTEAAERKTREGRGRDNYGQVLDEVAIKQPGNVAITLDDIDRKNLAIALLGQAADINVSAGTVTDEVVTATLGARIPLAHRHVLEDPAVVVTNDDASTTYVLGDDYTIEYRLGQIIPVDGGAITNGQEIKVSYSYGALTGTRIDGGVKPQSRLRLLLDGKNLATGESVIVTVDEALLTPEGPVDFMSADFVTLPLSGSMKLLEGKAAPYTVEVIDA